MSWLFSRALVEEYLGDICSDGEQSAQSNGNPTQLAYLPQDKMTDFSRLSRFGMTFKPLTADRGKELLMSYLAAFHAKTSPQPEKGQELTESDQECGEKWQGSFTKYDRDSCSWKTHQCSLLGGLEQFSETWPRWGLMRNGECWEQPMLERRTSATVSGFWPTPLAQDAKHSGYAKSGPGMADKLSYAVVRYQTPVARMWKDASHPSEHKRNSPTLAMQAGGTLNPTWVEWLMGWPLGWTDLKPLEMDKYHSWLQQHGKN
jgi:hypothetical protein